ncbi:MAG: hypothetical protein KC656_32520 [Myxococcales bacterium]|nr:hypothetical protein [Myxococcales bacterium]MCB9671945.1 hypothetical protein [Alphaproteobacteria bacterium]
MFRMLAIPLLSGCLAEPPDGEALASALTTRGGCGDLVVYAASADHTLLLRVDAPGLVAEAREAGTSVFRTVTLPDPAVTVLLDQGGSVDDAICDDVIENGGPQVRRTLEAVSGTAMVTVRPDGEGRADVQLTDVGLEGDGGAVTLPAFSWTDVAVGWLPG